MNFSFWEYDSWFSNPDFTIVGSGLTGLNCALRLRELFPKSKILVLERGILPNGASTKNAGFACFGSISEILDDLSHHSEEEVFNLVRKRISGLELLRKNLGDENLDYHNLGGYELFPETHEELFQKCLSEKDRINRLLFPLFKENVFSLEKDKFGFKNIIESVFFNKFEGQLNTGKMMLALVQKAQKNNIRILNNISVESFTETALGVKIKTNEVEFSTRNLIIATNGFAAQLGIPKVKPARAQVLITKPIEDLHIKGTFHLEQGFYYFRNIDNRILLGGGRNLDLKAEETTEMQETLPIQNKLEELLKQVIRPGKEVEIEHRWSGIMGVGNQKKPVVKQLSEHVFCGVRLGGMGVAIGSLVGKELADLLKN